jgi:uncharacterized membrane protein
MSKKSKNKKNTVKKEAVRARHWVELMVLFLLAGILVGNSFYVKGYDCTALSFQGGAIDQYYGYVQTDSTFQYNGDENSYILINTLDQENDQLVLSFLNCPEKDVTVLLNYYNEDGTQGVEAEETVWKKGNYYLKFDHLQSGIYSRYLISIPADFTFQNAYYAVDNERTNTKLMFYYFAVLIAAMVLSGIILCIPVLTAGYLAAEKKVMDFFLAFKSNALQKGKYILCFLGTVLVCELAAVLLQNKWGYEVSGKTGIVFGVVGILAGIFLFFRRYMEKRIECIGFFVILLLGSVFSFTEPSSVGVSWDDEIHFANAVQLSHLLDHKLSIADTSIIGEYTSVALDKYNYAKADQKRNYQVYDALERSHYYTDSPATVINNVMIAYIPSAIGLVLGRGIGLPFHMTIYLGRWMNVWLLAILSYFSMKRLKSGKIVVLLIALLPTNIFLAGNYTYDVWLTAWSVFGLSSFFGEWQQPEKKITWKAALVVALPMYLAVLPKLVYFPLTFITLFLPAGKFKTTRDCWIYRAGVIAAALLPFVSVYTNNLSGAVGQGDTRGGEAVNATSQLDFVKSSPVEAMKIIGNFLKGYLNPLSQGNEYITKMAYVGYAPIDSKYLLLPIILGAGVSRQEREPKFPWWTKAGVLLVYGGIGFIAAFSMYVSFTAVGSTEVAGCQGRYLIPALFPLLYVWTRFPGKPRVKNVLRAENIHIFLLALLAFVSIWTLMVGCINLYR